MREIEYTARLRRSNLAVTMDLTALLEEKISLPWEASVLLSRFLIE